MWNFSIFFLVLCAFWAISSIFWFFENFQIFQNSTNSCLAEPVSLRLFLMYSVSDECGLWLSQALHRPVSVWIVPDLTSPRCQGTEYTLGSHGATETRLLQRPVGVNNEAGRVWMRYRLPPAETACGIHRDWLASFEETFENNSKIFKIFEKSKNARNCLKNAQNQKIFKNFEKNLNVKCFKFFWYCALFGQFLAYFDFLKISKFFKIPTHHALQNRYSRTVSDVLCL
jgi:hypothetical protein